MQLLNLKTNSRIVGLVLNKEHYACLASLRVYGLNSPFLRRNTLNKLLQSLGSFINQKRFFKLIGLSLKWGIIVSEHSRLLLVELLTKADKYMLPYQVRILSRFLPEFKYFRKTRYYNKIFDMPVRLLGLKVSRWRSKKDFYWNKRKKKFLFRKGLVSVNKKGSSIFLSCWLNNYILLKKDLLPESVFKLLKNMKKHNNFRSFKSSKKRKNYILNHVYKRRYYRYAYVIIKQMHSNVWMGIADLNYKLYEQFTIGAFTESNSKRVKRDFWYLEYAFKVYGLHHLRKYGIRNIFVIFEGPRMHFGLKRLVWSIRKSRFYIKRLIWRLRLPHNAGMRKPRPRRL